MFSYYVPSAKKLENCDLAYALDMDTRSFGSRQILRNGPDGGGGWIYSHSQDLGYFPDRQHWEAMHDSPVWLGWPHQPPADLASLLARTSQLPGDEVELSNGQSWLVPLIRRPVIEDSEIRWTVTLPRTLRYEAGRWANGPVERRYQQLYDIGMQWFQVRLEAVSSEDGSTELEVSVDEAINWSVTMLAQNYRLGPHEVSAAGLINQYNFSGVLDAAVDWHRFTLLVKKKATASEATTAAISNSANGQKDSTRDTGRPSRTLSRSA